MNSNAEMLKVLSATVEGIVSDIATAQDADCDFVVSVSPIDEYVLTIIAGYPPTLVVDSSFVMSIILEPDEKKRHTLTTVLRRKLSLAVSRLPRMQRTLAIQPLAEAIALKQEAQRFVRTAFPNKVLPVHIDESNLEIKTQITVTVREVQTGMSVTLTGLNESILRARAISQLTTLIALDDALREKVTDSQYRPEPKPSAISINKNLSEDKVTYDYQ